MNFITVNKPLYFIVKLLGFFPATVNVEKSRKFTARSTKLDRSYSAAVAFTPIILITYFCFNVADEGRLAGILDDIWKLVTQYGNFIPAIAIAHQLWNHDKILQFIENILQFDENCIKKGIFLEHEKHVKWVKLALVHIGVFIIVVVSMFSLNAVLKFNLPIRMASSQFLQLFYTNFFGIQFIVVALSVSSRYHELNNYLGNISFRSKHEVKQISKLFDDLLHIIQLVNSTFSFSIILVLAAQFIMGTFTFYSDMEHLRSPVKNAKFWYQNYSSFSMITLQIVLTLLVGRVGNEVSEESQRTFVLLTQKINNSYNDEVNNELGLFMMQLKCRNKNLENIFFVIDWRLIFGVSLEYSMRINL